MDKEKQRVNKENAAAAGAPRTSSWNARVGEYSPSRMTGTLNVDNMVALNDLKAVSELLTR